MSLPNKVWGVYVYTPKGALHGYNIDADDDQQFLTAFTDKVKKHGGELPFNELLKLSNIKGDVWHYALLSDGSLIRIKLIRDYNKPEKIGGKFVFNDLERGSVESIERDRRQNKITRAAYHADCKKRGVAPADDI